MRIDSSDAFACAKCKARVSSGIVRSDSFAGKSGLDSEHRVRNEGARTQNAASHSEGDGSSQTKTASPSAEALQNVLEGYFESPLAWQRRIESLEKNVRTVRAQLAKFVSKAPPSFGESLGESIAQIHKEVASFSTLLRKHAPGPNSASSDYPANPNAVEEQVSDRADSNMLARFVERLPSAGGLFQRVAGRGGEARESDHRRTDAISIEALRELLADFSKRATDQEASQRVLESLPLLFDLLAPFFNLLDSGYSLPDEIRELIKDTREGLRDWQNRIDIHPVPQSGDNYDPRTARIIDRVKPEDPAQHNRVKEVTKCGYEWSC